MGAFGRDLTPICIHMMAATIMVEWGDELHSITLTPRNWSKVKSGTAHRQRGKGYHCGTEFLWDYWEFGGGLDGELIVDYGKDGGQGYVGRLSDAEIREHPPINKVRRGG